MQSPDHGGHGRTLAEVARLTDEQIERIFGRNLRADQPDGGGLPDWSEPPDWSKPPEPVSEPAASPEQARASFLSTLQMFGMTPEQAEAEYQRQMTEANREP